METPPSLIELLLVRVEAYSKTTLELAKFKTFETISVVISTLASRLIFSLIIMLFVIFLSIGFALYLGDLLEKIYYGFFVVAGFYLVIGTVFYFSLDKWIKKPLSDLMVSHLNDI